MDRSLPDILTSIWRRLCRCKIFQGDFETSVDGKAELSEINRLLDGCSHSWSSSEQDDLLNEDDSIRGISEGSAWPNLSDDGSLACSLIDCKTELDEEPQELCKGTEDENEEEEKILTLTSGDVALFANVLKARRRKKVLREELRGCERSMEENRQLLLEGERELQGLKKHHPRAPLELLRQQKRIQELEHRNRQCAELFEFEKWERQRLVTSIEKGREENRANKVRFFDSYEAAFIEAQVLNEGSDRRSHDGCSSGFSISSPSGPLTPEPDENDLGDAARLQKVSELNMLKRQISTFRSDLSNHDITYDSEKQSRRDLITSGHLAPSFTTTLFDVEMLRDNMATTRALIDAEVAYRVVKLQRQELGCTNDSSQESDFVDDPDDGYRESLELEATREVDRGRIYRWLDGLCAAPKVDQPSSRHENNPGKGLASLKRVAIGESLSVIASNHRDREKILWWRAVSAEQRHEAEKEKLHLETTRKRR